MGSCNYESVDDEEFENEQDHVVIEMKDYSSFSPILEK